MTFNGGKTIEKPEDGKLEGVMKEITNSCQQKYVTPTLYYE